MGRAVIERQGDAVTYAMPRNLGIIAGSITVIAVSVAIALTVLRSDGDGGVWTWLLPAVVTLGLLPGIANALAPQRLRIDHSAITLERWFGRRRVDWSEATAVVSYSDGQDLFLRVTTPRSRVMLSTRWAGWDAAEMRDIARRVDQIIAGHAPHLERSSPLERFPSWLSKESGLSK